MDNQKKFWVGLSHVKGLGPVRFEQLLDHFGDVEAIWQASPAVLREVSLPEKVISNFLKIRASLDLDQILSDYHSKNISVLTWQEDDYPQRLRNIPASPPVLYLNGELGPEDRWSVGVVGTRKITQYGRQVTEEICGTLASQGITIVSGLARGVDTIAHKAALEAGGRTLAILGCGVDRIYPAENHALAHQIVKNGAMISDYVPGTPPDGANFPPRNRIISGLTMATIVIEAGERSGALITARNAIEQGKDVFAVPGPIYAPMSKGPNRLIQEGAFPLLSAKDVLDVLDLEMIEQKQEVQTVLPADAFEVTLYEALKYEPLHIDEIKNKVNMPINKVSATLTMMELKGLVKQVGKMRYMVIKEMSSGYNAK
jgi:DNA processing protein